MTSGYLHADYVHSLTGLGQPRRLPEAQGWILKRRIPGSDRWDAMGAYPFFNCRYPERLDRDLKELTEELVSVTVVTDPFADFSPGELQRTFPDLVRPFKDHFIMDLGRRWEETVCAHHRRNARRALAAVEIERRPPESARDEWITLYNHLIERHRITGFAAFPPESLTGQLRVPGLVLLRAVHRDQTVGMTLWYVNEDRAYYHLAAYSPLGYRLKASFALFWRAAEILAGEGVRWINLGAGAGLESDGTDGLSRFKRGWATVNRPVYLCGRILDHRVYTALVKDRALDALDYFPAYRSPNYDSGSRHKLLSAGRAL
ncbi:MAG TPA: GNAT family N-acetyltransferase [Blastocatellia bacterium]|nr:GNAT family N-acetyltransferase [Blastocatellia bacterium]